MTEFVVALVAFVASHAAPAAAPLRARLVARLGERVYLVLYSAASLGMLWWLASAYGRAPYVELWPHVSVLRWVTVAAMPLACILLVPGVTGPNPLSVGRGGAGFDPARPGIVAVTRHPVLWAFAVWAGAHLPPNGDAASVLLFGTFLAISLAGPALVDRKRRAALGAAEWARLAAGTSNLPLAALLAGRARLRGVGVGSVLAALALYVVLLFGHPLVIGVDPIG